MHAILTVQNRCYLSRLYLARLLLVLFHKFFTIHHAFSSLEMFLADLLDGPNIMILSSPRHYLFEFQVIKN